MTDFEHEDIGGLYLEDNATASDTESPVSLEGVPERMRVLFGGDCQAFFDRFLDATFDSAVEFWNVLCTHVGMVGKCLCHTYFLP